MMRRAYVTLLLAILCWAVTAPVAAASSGGNSDAAHQCQQGGYQSLHRADGSSFSNPGECVSYAARDGVFAPLSVPLSITFSCNTFEDFYVYSFAFGPGAPSGLTSLSYIFATPAGFYAGTQAQGTVVPGATATVASSAPAYPNSYVRTNRLTETSAGTYTFNMEVEFELTPATLTVSAGVSGTTDVPPAGSLFCSGLP
jgi:hypothetical protein